MSENISARDRILRSAHNLFYRDGIRATGIDRIIATASVTKATFYRHFPSKNALIKAYLDYRHTLWIDKFAEALERHRGKAEFALDTVSSALHEWFDSANYRGCAFINAVVELDAALPEVGAIAQAHKTAMAQLIGDLLPASAEREALAGAVALAIDGAIIRAQMDKSPENALRTLAVILRALQTQ
jgi:AcrR family transcriptional regulator